jgi:hypothetical protein
LTWDHTEACSERTRQNGGIVPDNVGPNGVIGELMDGKGWGGYYGWRWPHGFNHILEPILIAASNCTLLTGDASWVDFPRSQIDRVWELGQEVGGRWVVPHRRGDAGFYDFRPMNPTPAITLWSLTHAEEDRERVERIRAGEVWNHVADHRGKGEYNHSAPWYAWLQGHYPDYPDEILRFTYREMHRRLALILADDGADPAEWDVHHWQDRNPVGTEALVQLTLGAPNALYHGGLLHAPIRYFDTKSKKPGLPTDVSALVTAVQSDAVRIQLSNADPLHPRTVTIQAGTFGEHHFTKIDVDGLEQSHPFPTRYVTVELAPSTLSKVELKIDRYRNRPDYRQPWDAK